MKPPLAERLRPQTLDELVGQDEALTFIRKIIDTGHPLSLILHGPPGCGKTTLARLYAGAFQARFVPVANLAAFKEALAQRISLLPTIIFVDEIHRFNKAQQDAFLPHLERGTITLIGATTENPSFSLNNALLSRLRVLDLGPLSDEALEAILDRCEEEFDATMRRNLIELAQGDGRYLLNLVEQHSCDAKLQRRAPLYDRQGDGHYNLISALHKSVRGSDPDASLYWLARMLAGGEDPLYIARRLLRMASEDIGLADPQALSIVLSARDTFQMLGSPEGELALAQATIYLALAPKSNAVYTAFKAVQKVAADTGQLSPPNHILNHGTGYLYDHDQPNAFSGQDYFPSDLPRAEFYTPVSRGFEREMSKRLTYFKKLRQTS